MPSVKRAAVDDAVLAYFCEKALDLEATKARNAAAFNGADQRTQAALAAAEQQVTEASARVERSRAPGKP